MRFNAVSVASLGVLAILAPMSVKASHHNDDPEAQPQEDALVALFNEKKYTEFASAFVQAAKDNSPISAEAKEAWKAFGPMLANAIKTLEGQQDVQDDGEESDAGNDNDSVLGPNGDAEGEEEYFEEQEDEEDSKLTPVNRIDRRLQTGNIVGAISLFNKYREDPSVTEHPAMVGHMLKVSEEYFAQQELEDQQNQEQEESVNEDFEDEEEEGDKEDVAPSSHESTFNYLEATNAEKIAYHVAQGEFQDAINVFHATPVTERTDEVMAAYRTAANGFLSIEKPGATWEELTAAEKVCAFWTAKNWSDVILQFESAKEECKDDSRAYIAYLDAQMQQQA